MFSAIDWTPWNITEMPTTPGTSTVANADDAAADWPPTAWPICGNTYRNTKHSRNGWMTVRSTNSQKCLRTTTRSRSSSAPSAVQLAAATERSGRSGGSAGGRPAGAGDGGGAAVVAISRAAPSRSG